MSDNMQWGRPSAFIGIASRVERLEHPRVEAGQLSGQRDRYKIKLKSPGIRLVYHVEDQELIVFVLAVDKRERSTVYDKASGRFYQRE